MLPDSMTLPATRWAKARGCTCPEVTGASVEYGLWPGMDVTWDCPMHGLEAILKERA